jgi:hypothetical protein
MQKEEKISKIIAVLKDIHPFKELPNELQAVRDFRESLLKEVAERFLSSLEQTGITLKGLE